MDEQRILPCDCDDRCAGLCVCIFCGIDPSIALRNCGSPQTVEEVPAAVRYKASGGLYDDPESVIAHWLAKLDERAKRGR